MVLAIGINPIETHQHTAQQASDPPWKGAGWLTTLVTALSSPIDPYAQAPEKVGKGLPQHTGSADSLRQ